jgi:tetratricopeptide (TPR) repeat protein
MAPFDDSCRGRRGFEMDPMQSKSARPRTRRGAAFAAWAALLALVTFAAFVPALSNGFIVSYDDGQNFLQNPHLRGLEPSTLRWAWTTNRLGVYQPLAWVLLEAEYATWGLEASGYHLVSLLFHCLNAIALMALAAAVCDRVAGECDAWNLTGAALGSALFAVHPLRVEAVAWASCQPYTACAFFALCAVLAYLHGHKPGCPVRARWLLASWLFLAVALLFKAIAVTIPAVLVVLDVYPLRRLGRDQALERTTVGLRTGGRGRPCDPPVPPLREGGTSQDPPLREGGNLHTPPLAKGGPGGVLERSARAVPLLRAPGKRSWARSRGVCLEKLPFLALGLVFMIIAAAAKRYRVELPRPLPDGPLARATQASYAACFYLVKTFWPSGLSSDYPLPHRWYGFDPPFLASLVAVLGLTALFIGLRRRFPGLVAAWAIFLVALAPNSGLVRTNDQVATDRYSYLPSMAIAVVVAYVFSRFCRFPRSRRLVIAAGCVAVAILAMTTWRQCLTWHDDIALYSRVVAAAPRNARGHLQLGLAWERQGRFDEAESHYRRARELASWLPHPSNNLGLIRLREGRYDAARAFLREAVRRDPTFVDAYANMGFLYARQGRWGEAVPWYERVTRLSPDSPRAHRTLAEALKMAGRYEEARSHLQTALALDPRGASARHAPGDAVGAENRSGATLKP